MAAKKSPASKSPTNKSPANEESPIAPPPGLDEVARAMPFNAAKPSEIGTRGAAEGQVVEVPSKLAASTPSEKNGSAKVGPKGPPEMDSGRRGSLERARVDSSGQQLTTNQGVPIADNQNSLKAGLRGPTLLEDFILREKITHFDHERIPERIVHARGSGAHGYFECTDPLSDVTRASLFGEKGKRTPLFARFSTVAGERGSTDAARDVRGFAVKFYTDEGNWDLVGNNIPVFFIQDAMKFPDLIHAVKPEPHNGMPQAQSAHDTFWDFVSLMPESTHTLMWVMSDRGIPRSYRMMQGFGVHTYRFVDAEGASVFVKFHWSPVHGTHSLVWDEALKISGADPDFHRRDLWDAIDAGAYPEWELSVQVFDEKQAAKMSFDVLDATKIVPEEMVPLRKVGRMVLDRNPDNFFAETEQVAFCVAHVVPGIDFSNDPLLAGRIHSYIDTQISRLGGANFHEIPINAPLAPVHNNQRDGMHRQAIPRGRVAYEPNSLGGGCPFQAGATGFVSAKVAVSEHKVRGKPEKFAEHYNQATLFWDSQSEVEKRHIAAAFRFELSKVTVPAIRERMVSSLRNVSDELASEVADGLGIALPEPMPRVLPKAPTPEVKRSPSLSLFARPGSKGAASRRVAIVVGDGVDAGSALEARRTLKNAGVMASFVGTRLGPVRTDGEGIEVEAALEGAPSVVWDGILVADAALVPHGHLTELLVTAYRHCKPILALGKGAAALKDARLPTELPSGEADPGLIIGSEHTSTSGLLKRFQEALAKHRTYERETDPPRV